MMSVSRTSIVLPIFYLSAYQPHILGAIRYVCTVCPLPHETDFNKETQQVCSCIGSLCFILW